MDSSYSKCSLVRVEALRIGMRLDLEGDPIADNGEHPEFESEYEVVSAIEVETQDCTRVDFESGFSCGFPPAHEFFVSCRCPSAEHGTACPFGDLPGRRAEMREAHSGKVLLTTREFNGDVPVFNFDQIDPPGWSGSFHIVVIDAVDELPATPTDPIEAARFK